MNLLDFFANNLDRTLELAWEHVWMVGIALIIAVLLGVPLGIWISRHEAAASRVIASANLVMTIPSIALFGLMLPVLSPLGQGLGMVPAVIALVLYSQLPIIRNTHAAITGAPVALVEAGRGMGMGGWALLWQVQLPLALPVILAGLRIAAVMCIGIGAIAAYIGAGGLGVLIQQGIARAYPEMILAGALAVSLLAVIVDGFMALLERLLTPRGIRLERGR